MTAWGLGLPVRAAGLAGLLALASCSGELAAPLKLDASMARDVAADRGASPRDAPAPMDDVEEAAPPPDAGSDGPDAGSDGPDAGSDAPPPDAAVCSDDSSRCTDSGPLTGLNTCAGGAWVDAGSCSMGCGMTSSTTAACKDCDSTSYSGNTRCVDGGTETCKSPGFWGSWVDCPYGCTYSPPDGEGYGEYLCNACTGGTKRCQKYGADEWVQVCEDSYEFYSYGDAGGGDLYDGGYMYWVSQTLCPAGCLDAGCLP